MDNTRVHSLTSRHIDVWRRELKEDLDKDFILTGLESGFSLVDPTVDIPVDVLPAETQNHKSACDSNMAARIEAQILSEMEDGNYIPVSSKPTIVSALGAIPKRDGGVRIIQDCSQPEGTSLNDYATKDPCCYQTIEEALSMIGPGWYMAKVDLQSAYRSVGIRPAEYCMTGFTWPLTGKDGKYFVDSRLPFGARKSPAIFNRITQSVRRMMQRRGFQSCVVVLDDFLIVGPSFREVTEALNCLIQLLRSLGFRINWNKVVGPTQDIVFLGVRIMTLHNRLHLDPAKVSELRALINHHLGATRLSKLQLQSLAGKLSWASHVIHWGRTHICSIHRLISTLQERNHKARLNSISQDLAWWQHALNIGHYSRHIWDSRPWLTLHTDSSQTGGGAFCTGHWLYRNWQLDTTLAPAHINVKELAMVREALTNWGPSMANMAVLAHLDNAAAVAFITKGTSRNPYIIRILKDIARICLQYNINLHATFIRGIDNCIPDAISRLDEPGQLQRFIALLNAWHCTSAPVSYWLTNHMSFKSLCFLSPQVRKWQRLFTSWIRKSPAGDL